MRVCSKHPEKPWKLEPCFLHSGINGIVLLQVDRQPAKQNVDENLFFKKLIWWNSLILAELFSLGMRTLPALLNSVGIDFHQLVQELQYIWGVRVKPAGDSIGPRGGCGFCLTYCCYHFVTPERIGV